MKREGIAVHIIDDLKEIAVLTSDENGAQRVAWTPTWKMAAEWFAEKMRNAGAVVWMDAAGNSWAKFSGETEEAIVIGSHIDSVPNGGWLDGILGVVAGMGVGIYGLAGRKPKKQLYVVGWVDEEGVVFGTSCLGSGIVSGSITVQKLLSLKNKEGKCLKEVWKSYGLDPYQADNAKKRFDAIPVKAYAELHIEQAPLLARSKKAVACVYGVCGCHRQYIIFKGQQGHCGSPVALRHDAFIAAAEATLDFKNIALRYQSYCTVGHVEVGPNVNTISPGYCRISLDQRCIDADSMKKMISEAKKAAAKRGDDNQVTVSDETIWHEEPILFDNMLVQKCQKAVQDETGERTMMYSAPLHDAVEMYHRVPTIMMFVQSDPGISHCKEEDTPLPVLQKAICAFLRFAEEVLETRFE